MLLKKIRVSQNFSQISGFSPSPVFARGRVGVSIFCSMFNKSRASRTQNRLTLVVSQSLACTISHTAPGFAFLSFVWFLNRVHLITEVIRALALRAS